jgi:hypothetical protein
MYKENFGASRWHRGFLVGHMDGEFVNNPTKL